MKRTPCTHPLRGKRYLMTNDDLRTRTIAELQRIAIDGKAPTKAQFDLHRDPELPTSNLIQMRLDMPVTQLAVVAGLTLGAKQRATYREPEPPQPEPPSDYSGLDDLSATAVLGTIRPELRSYDFALDVKPTHTEVVQVRLPNGDVVRRTRTYAMVK